MLQPSKGSKCNTHLPKNYYARLNIDGSARNGVITGGGVIHDSRGQTVASFSSFYEQCTIKGAGFLALMDGLEMSTALGNDNLDIESDSQVVVEAITKMDCPNWRYSYILRQCQGMWRDSFSITHIFCQANMVADSCAH